MLMRAKFIITTILLVQVCKAQSPEEIKQVFPDHNVVYQNYEQQLDLFIKDNLPAAERKTQVDMLMLTDKTINMPSRYKVYHSGYNELSALEAFTKVPSGSKYKTVKVTETKTTTSTDNSIFYDDMKETTFDFPALTQNAIAHVEYTQLNKDAHLLTAFYLPSYMPIVNASYTVTVPNEITIKYIVKNAAEDFFTFTTDKKRKETVYRWTLKNYKSVDNFGNAPDSRYFQPHIIVYVTSFEGNDGPQPFLNTLNDLYKWNYSFLKDLNNSEDPAMRKIVDSITNGVKDESSKAKKIYAWVQQHIKYVAFEDGLEGFKPRQAAEICARRYGDCKDMSSIITQMLRMAGLKSYYTWIGTRDIPYKYSEIPLPIVDNHMISTVFINGNWIFLDGTDPTANFELPPSGIQGKEALIAIGENEYKVLTVPIAQPEKNELVDSTFIHFSENGVNGFQSVNYNGYFGEDVYNALLYHDETSIKDYVTRKMSKGSNKFKLGKYNISKVKPEENLVTISADFELPGYSKKIGSEYYINLNLEKLLDNRIIDTSLRKVPWENEYNYSIRQYHILEIPEGYKVTYLPRNFSFENELIKIDFYYKIENSRVISAQEIKNKKLLINPSEFDEWNKPMKAVQPFYKESVVLEKTN